MGCISFLDGLHIVSGWAAYRQPFLDGLHIVSEKFLAVNRFWMGCISSDMKFFSLVCSHRVEPPLAGKGGRLH